MSLSSRARELFSLLSRKPSSSSTQSYALHTRSIELPVSDILTDSEDSSKRIAVEFQSPQMDVSVILDYDVWKHRLDSPGKVIVTVLDVGLAD